MITPTRIEAALRRVLSAAVHTLAGWSHDVDRVGDGSTEGWLKATTSRMFYRIWSAFSGVQIVRGTADFRLIDRAVPNIVPASTGSLTFLRGLIHWIGYRTVRGRTTELTTESQEEPILSRSVP